jgi:hypothetical protein
LEEKRDFKSGATSTKQVRLSLIPHSGLVNAAKRFEVGLETHKEKAYNALSTNTAALADVDWLIERCSHAIEHLYCIIDQLKHRNLKVETLLPDAGAVAWCGLVLGEAFALAQESRPEPPTPRKQQPMEYDPKDGGPN